MKVREYEGADRAEWMRMRVALWPELGEENASDQQIDANVWLSRGDAAVLVAERSSGGGLAGFVEVGERSFADGCETNPVGYLEDWYVDVDCRGQGVGRALIKRAMGWCSERGYRELASDALLQNIQSQQAHEALGFHEVERAVRYRMSL